MAFKKGESGNPSGRPPKISPERLLDMEAAITRMDSWVNFSTAMGTSSDKRVHSWFSPDVVTDIEALGLYRGDDICKRGIDSVPHTAFRRGFTLKTQDKEQDEEIQSELEELSLVEKFVTACCYERAYGGAALFPVTSDIGDLSEPLDEANIPSITAYHVLEPRELSPVSWYTDIASPKFRLPELYRFIPASGMVSSITTHIHESRLIIFPGRRITHQIQSYQRPGWGDSILTGVYAIVRDFGSAWGNAAALLEDFAQGVLQMDGYEDLMKEQGGEAVVKARLRMLDMMRSTMRAIVIGAKDSFSRQQTPMGGLSDILHDFALRVSAAFEIPVTVLFGMAPAGLNATGDNDIRGWYDTVSAKREHHYKPRLERAIQLYLLSKDGATGGIEPDVWCAEFPPLWEPTEKEVADTRLAVAQADKIYAVDIGAARPEDVAISRWKGDSYSPDMTIDWDALKAQEDAKPQPGDIAALMAAHAAAQGTKPPVDPNAPPPAPGADNAAA